MTDNPYERLRSAALAFTPGTVAGAAASDAPHIFGVIMDMGMDLGTATLAVFSDGSVSLYYSSGGGIIGAGEHERVWTAAARLLAVAHSEPSRVLCRRFVGGVTG
jgi:hypothetical protein